MSLWDKLKPAKRSAVVTSVEVSVDRRQVSLTFDDGVTAGLSGRSLRQACPCAGCVDERTGERTLDVEAVSTQLQVLDVAPVGNYAVRFTFDDHHDTGLYHFDFLRTLCRSPVASPKAE